MGKGFRVFENTLRMEEIYMSRFTSFVAALALVVGVTPVSAQVTTGTEPGYSKLEIGKRTGQLSMMMEEAPLIVGGVTWHDFGQIQVRDDKLGKNAGYKVLTLNPMTEVVEGRLMLAKSYTLRHDGRKLSILSPFVLSDLERMRLGSLVTTLKDNEKELVAAYKGDNIELKLEGTYAVYIYDGKVKRRGPIIVIDRTPVE